MEKWIEACKSNNPLRELKGLATTLYDNDSLYIVSCELAAICDKFNLVTQEDIVKAMYKPLTWGEFDGRDYRNTVTQVYINAIRFTKVSVFENQKEN
ncbi:hypothetical protein NVP1121O_261 [Vibrio phage 1.121.O._10N.286.46.C4]|nr:hypothetical protein NVP1121O_261 [Vibrio phage 1.121.O._10N.286.46.C4]